MAGSVIQLCYKYAVNSGETSLSPDTQKGETEYLVKRI